LANRQKGRKKKTRMAEPKSKKTPAGAKHAAPVNFSVSDIKELFILMKENDIAEINIEQGDTKIHVVGSRVLVAPPAVQPMMQVLPTMPQVAVAGAAQAPPSAAAAPAETKGEEPASAKATSAEAAEEGIPANVKTITSPIVGTFYRSPAPDAPPFVNVGDRVKEDTTLCIIEAMKLMNEIKAEMRGRIVKILVENGMPVEYNQPLFLVEPE
jgi:acetyl-CoA carboxylase biotin carboxyl carrier protein